MTLTFTITVEASRQEIADSLRLKRHRLTDAEVDELLNTKHTVLEFSDLGDNLDYETQHCSVEE